jgi:hypothetical protein
MAPSDHGVPKTEHPTPIDMPNIASAAQSAIRRRRCFQSEVLSGSPCPSTRGILPLGTPQPLLSLPPAWPRCRRPDRLPKADPLVAC